MEKEKERQEIIDKLEISEKDATKLIAKSRANALKRSSNRVSSMSRLGLGADYAKLLKTRSKAAGTILDTPHVPFQDDWYSFEDMYVLKPGGYDDLYSETVRKDREGIMRGGGYRVEEAWERALRFAVAGLDLPPLEGLDPDPEGIQSHPPPTDGDVIMAS